MRSALTYLLAACILLSGCVLPEGKLVAATSADAGTKSMPQRATSRTDAAVAGRDARDSEAGGAAADATEAGRSGTGGNPNHANSDEAEDAGASDAPKANGETCVTSSDCASGNCKLGRDGRRCYGQIAVDKPCSAPYDCDGYACIPETADGKNGVCVETSLCSSQNPCARDYWAATCQLDQLCSVQSSSFNQCYQMACTRPPDSNELCRSELAITKNLIALRCCPPAGAYHSSCDPAPQCGCQAGEKCDLRGVDAQAYCGPAGSGGDLDECELNRDCMAGYVCTNSGCNRYCDGPGDRLCSPTGACKLLQSESVTAPVFACTRTCDPTSPETTNGPFHACRSGQRCEPATDGNSDCLPGGGEGRRGAACNKSAKADSSLCAPGFGCVSATLSCQPFCKVGANDCEVGACVPDPDRKFAASTEIGHCAEP